MRADGLDSLVTNLVEENQTGSGTESTVPYLLGFKQKANLALLVSKCASTRGEGGSGMVVIEVGDFPNPSNSVGWVGQVHSRIRFL